MDRLREEAIDLLDEVEAAYQAGQMGKALYRYLYSDLDDISHIPDYKLERDIVLSDKVSDKIREIEIIVGRL